MSTYNGNFPAGFFDGDGSRLLRTRSAADTARVLPIEWLWRGYLPNGYLSLLTGTEGVGKGTLIAHLVGSATRGELSGAPVRVLIVGDEDAFYSVVVPRLTAAEADLELVDTIHEDDDHLALRADAEALRVLIEERRYGLVIFDSLLDTLGEIDSYKAQSVREEVRPLRRLARDLGVCVLALLHPNKGARASFRDLLSGSHAFNALARSSLLIAEHPSDPSRRLLVRGKGNLSATPPGFEFRIASSRQEINGHTFDVPVVVDAAESELTIADVLTPERKASVRDSLAEQIDRLGNSGVQTRAEIAAALDRPSDDRSIGRALDQLEDEGKWEKIGRGRWQRIGGGTYIGAAAKVGGAKVPVGGTS